MNRDICEQLVQGCYVSALMTSAPRFLLKYYSNHTFPNFGSSAIMDKLGVCLFSIACIIDLGFQSFAQNLLSHYTAVPPLYELNGKT